MIGFKVRAKEINMKKIEHPESRITLTLFFSILMVE